MTSTVRIVNHGPAKVRVKPCDPDTCQHSITLGEPKQIDPNEFLTFVVHGGVALVVEELKPQEFSV